MALIDWVDRFAVWEGFHPDLQTLLIYGAGIALYTALVFAFYQNISRRDPLHSGRGKAWWGRTLRVAETILTFPIVSFGYFAVMSLALFILAKPERATADILLLSMSCVMGVRFTAHASENMSNDIAKLLPLGLLAVVVVDPGYLTLASALGRVGEAGLMLPVLLQYFALFILVEAVLRGARRLVPGLSKLAKRIEHRRRLSKRAMLRDIEGTHESGGMFHKPAYHDHAPRDRSRDFLALDERMGGKPGSNQGLGPAVHEAKPRAAPSAHHAHKPRAGPGGKGGKLGAW